MKLQRYGYGTPLLLSLSSVHTHTGLPRSVVPAALKEKFIELIPSYMGALRSEVNPHFRMLLTRRKTLKMSNQAYLFGVYTAHAARALWQAVDVVYAAVKQQKRVLFISDKETEEQLEIQSLNCMLYEPRLHALISELGSVSFYYTNRDRTAVPLGQQSTTYFDLVVVCLKDYSRINRTTFRSFSRFTLGACAQSTRPNLFDYYVPALGTYQTSIQLLRDVAILGYLAR